MAGLSANLLISQRSADRGPYAAISRSIQLSFRDNAHLLGFRCRCVRIYGGFVAFSVVMQCRAIAPSLRTSARQPQTEHDAGIPKRSVSQFSHPLEAARLIKFRCLEAVGHHPDQLAATPDRLGNYRFKQPAPAADARWSSSIQSCLISTMPAQL
jgi:hypothetical protein